MHFLVNAFHLILSNAWAAVLVVLFFGGSIFVHELGHFLAARLRKVKVERFSIGFGPALWSRRGRDGVEYRLAPIPLGGYVLLPQLADLGVVEGAGGTDVSTLPPVGYASKMIVFVAGALFNMLFAFALACVVWIIGQPEDSGTASTRIGYVSPTVTLADGTKVPSPASQAALQPGDLIVAIDGHKVSDWPDLVQSLNIGSGRDERGQPQCVLTIVRSGLTMKVILHPLLATFEKVRQIGIGPDFELVVYDATKGSPAASAGFLKGDRVVSVDGVPMRNDRAFSEYLDANRGRPLPVLVSRAGAITRLEIPARPAGDFGLEFILDVRMTHPSPLAQIWEQVALTFRTLWSLINPRSDIGLSKLAGPVGIVRIFGSAAASGIRALLMFTILVNVNLAVFNLLPIPVLDGGQMAFATIGKLRGRALPMNFIATAQSVFIVLLFSMILYVSYFNVRSWAHDVESERGSAASAAKP